MYLFVSQIQGLTWFIEEGNLERRMQISSSGEEKDLVALMKLQKMCQSHLEGQKCQQGELTFL
jgi:hypothetical protein